MLSDQLEINGDASLDGDLTVDIVTEFTPNVGDSFEFLNVGGLLTGEFSGLPEGATVGNFSDRDLFITYTAGDGNDGLGERCENPPAVSRSADHLPSVSAVDPS